LIIVMSILQRELCAGAYSRPWRELKRHRTPPTQSNRISTVDPLTTYELFQHGRVAAGYASARPFLHPEVFAQVRDLIRAPKRLGWALDVGCGTGMSSVALLALSQHVVGVDASVEMLRLARKGDRLHYLASSAEALPFRGGRFDLIAACGSIDWVDRALFMPRAADLLVTGGFLVPLDFGDLGRSARIPALQRWYEDVFHRAHPRPPAGDPMVTSAEAASHGFSPPVNASFASSCTFTSAQYADFLMTESEVTAAVEYGGQAADRVRAWLLAELDPMFGGAPREVSFGGYIQVLRKL
jgi:SAM-dependent methyltransferase